MIIDGIPDAGVGWFFKESIFDVIIGSDESFWYSEKDLRFDSDWNLLIAAIRKIAMRGNTISLYFRPLNENEIAEMEEPIITAWHTVLEFIDEYKEKQPIKQL